MKSKKYCKQCSNELTRKSQKVFCSTSCSATFHNLLKGKKPLLECKWEGCNNIVKTPSNRYCSRVCFGYTRRKYRTIEEIRLMNRETTRRYQARKRYQTPVGADLEAIRQFYLDCPEGYEVDHIQPISKGGIHCVSNMQYLTPFENKSKGDRCIINDTQTSVNV